AVSRDHLGWGLRPDRNGPNRPLQWKGDRPMTRSRWLLLAAAVATSAVGCAHCGVQDEMPAPCVAGGCADCGGMIAPVQPALPPPMVLGSPTLMTMPAPSVIQSSPATAPAGGSG